jgi:hypothetical protein
MSMNIDPSAVTPPEPLDPVAVPAAADGSSDVTAVPADDDAVSVELSGVDTTASVTASDAVPARPPSSVFEAIGTAAGAYAKLAQAGTHVFFGSSEQDGSFAIELQSGDGSSTPLSASDVLKLAAGEEID